jgi:hypothetical protein
VSLSSLSTAVDALVVAAGFTVALTKDPTKIPAHRAALDLIVDVRAAVSGRGAMGRREVYDVEIVGIYPETMRASDSERTALAGLETIRDALAAAGALATVPARVIRLEMSQESTGNGSIAVAVTAEIHATR